MIIAGLTISVGFVSKSVANNWDKITFLLELEGAGKNVLLKGLPALAQYELQDEPDYESPSDLIQQAINMFSAANIGDPKVFLNSQLSYLQLARVNGNEPLTQEEIIFFERDYTPDELLPEQEEKKEAEEKQPFIKANGEPLVVIYNSHNGETYTPDAGVPRIDGTNGGVVQVAEVLAAALEKNHGIPAIRSEEIHDYPSYALSYANSLKTVEEILKKYPSVEIVIDVHRDYQPTRAQTTATVSGQEAAKIMFVVGNDARQSHPHWHQNLAFVTSLEKKMNEIYTNLSRGIRQQDGRYNQHLHPRAILVEIGSAENNLAEAKRSAEMLADVLAQILLEIQQKKVNM